MVIAQQQRQVGGGACGGKRHRPHTQILDALETGGMAVGVCRQHHLGAASQRLAADLVGVADDELRPITGLAQDVGAAADADQDRLVLLDERLERLQVGGGAELLGDDHHVPAADVDVDVGDADAVDQQRALTADELDRVAGERLEVSHQAALRLVHQFVDLVVGALGAEDQPAVSGVHPTFVESHACAVLDLLEDLGPSLVDQDDAVGHEYLRSEVGVATGDGRRRVDDRGDVCLDERVGGDPVKVQSVDDDDVTRGDSPQ